MTYEWLFNRVELLVKKRYDTDVSVFDRDVVVKVDFEKAVINALSTRRCATSSCFFHFAQSIYKSVRKRCWQEYKTNPNAKKYDTMPISEIVDKKLGVIDLAAAVLAMENKMPMMLFGLNDTNSIEKAVTGGFTGTTVTVE